MLPAALPDLCPADAADWLETHLPGPRFTAAQHQRLARLVAARAWADGALIVAQGAPAAALFGVLSGEVETRLGAADGGVSVIERVRAGQLFGLSSFATGLPSSYEALAHGPTRLWVFGPAAYALLMDEVPGFARALLADLTLRHHRTLQQLGAARHLSAGERLRLALRQLEREAPGLRTEEPADWRRLRVTQQQLAALAGLSRQTVNEGLAELAAQGLLRRSYGALWLAPELGP
jgi:CRP-like cAMP-binding protein